MPKRKAAPERLAAVTAKGSDKSTDTEDSDDLFDAFEDDAHAAASPSGADANKMARLEKAKTDDAKARAAALLAQLMAGSDESSLANESKQKQAVMDDDDEVMVVEDDEEPKSKTAFFGDEEMSAEQNSKIDSIVDSDANFLSKAPSIEVHKIDMAEPGCVHEVCIPPGGKYVPLALPDTEPAKTYPFQLDPFQKEAILCIDNYQSVLVSAHTSAGKTVVALYAIALSMRNRQRVIYTSPIKALSNQKYRELKEEFNDVGLMTGDVTISPNASCLVMTTEILRSMLYRGSEVMREVGWVVFDEIHYMRDKERGVVWEETIILLPHEVHLVFLSATIPNARQFAEWVCYLHSHPCHVVYTEFRPTPLQHFIYPAGGSSLFEVVDVQGNFLDSKFDAAMACVKTPEDLQGGEQTATDGSKPMRVKKRGGTSGDSVVQKLIRTLSDSDLLPVIVFSFARRECEGYAAALNDIDFSDPEEKHLIREIFTNSIYGLSEDDKQLPSVSGILPYLERGIGIHHSGLLPILKEVIEMMFGEGLIKVLFATETFAMGLNMPARTVVFTSAQKWLHSGEYIQMSGRAGRRGMDAKGVVILTVDQKLDSEVAKQIIKGKPDALNSQFRLTYNMVLNMMRVEAIYPEWMLQRSFAQFQSYATLPSLVDNRDKHARHVDTIHVPRLAEARAYYELEQQLDRRRREMIEIIRKPAHVLPFLQPGRLVKILVGEKDFGWGCLISYERKTVTVNPADPKDTKHIYVVNVLLNFAPFRGRLTDVNEASPCPVGVKGQPEVVPALLDSVTAISAVRIKYPSDLTPLDARLSVVRVIDTVKQRFAPDSPPLLDPIVDMNIKDARLKDIIAKIAALEQAYLNHPLRNAADFDDIYERLQRRLKAEAELKSAKQELKKAICLLKMDELRCRQRILRRLNYCDENGVIVHKGRVACEISAADELLLTEMLFAGAFNELSAQHAAALLSCFVAEDKADCPPLDDLLSGCLRQIQEHARRIAKVTNECKLPLEVEKYVDKFKPSMMGIVLAWCNGASFVDVCKIADIFEGSIIRTMRRLEELLREMRNAAHAIGNTQLKEKFDEARTRMKRDIVFAASLYLVGEEDPNEEDDTTMTPTATAPPPHVSVTVDGKPLVTLD